MEQWMTWRLCLCEHLIAFTAFDLQGSRLVSRQSDAASRRNWHNCWTGDQQSKTSKRDDKYRSNPTSASWMDQETWDSYTNYTIMTYFETSHQMMDGQDGKFIGNSQLRPREKAQRPWATADHPGCTRLQALISNPNSIETVGNHPS